jgi:hypothetical protein
MVCLVYAYCVRKDMGMRLRDGITARLEYDFACERGSSFGEYHLHGVINEIISAIIDPGLFKQYGGYAHPAINETPKRPGRPREVDFYVEHRDTKEARTCLEAKWAGSSHCTWEKILLDLYRLALVKEHSPTAECLFVLAGSRTNMDVMMKSMPVVWQGGNTQRKMRALQKPENRGHASLRYYNPVPWAVPTSFRRSLPRIPPAFRSNLAHNTKVKDSRWMTVVWSIQ